MLETPLPWHVTIYMRLDHFLHVFSLSHVNLSFFRFRIHYETGEITVAPCPTPMVSPCLDYETTREHRLTVIGRDKCGEGQEVETTVIVTVIDSTGDNNRPPIFNPEAYTRRMSHDEPVGKEPF